MVGSLGPGHDRDAQLVAGGPRAPVEDVLLQQAEEARHRRVVPGSSHSTHQSGHAVVADFTQELPVAELATSIAVDHAVGNLAAQGDGVCVQFRVAVVAQVRLGDKELLEVEKLERQLVAAGWAGHRVGLRLTHVAHYRDGGRGRHA